MNKNILNTVVQDFINLNLDKDTTSLLLKKALFENIDIKDIVEQLESKKRCKKKLPTWFKTPQIYYPNKVNIEQTSSEVTANYKLQIVSGKSIIDLTGGFGVDCYYFSKVFDTVIHCDINKELSTIVHHNYKQLGILNIQTVAEDGLDFLVNSKKQFDWIYIDPSRRHDVKGKVFYLKDCLPNVPEHLEALFSYSNNILVKASPMLDISLGTSELKHVKEIHVVAVKNEVKELLFVLEKNCTEAIGIKTINIKTDHNETFEFYMSDESLSFAIYSNKASYLYEPNAAILKAGAFKVLSQKLQVNKLHQHSHLYSSQELIDFPGRTFKIQEIIPYNKKEISNRFKGKKANITTRNFPLNPADIRKKFNIRDGGEQYLFFTTNQQNKKIAISCFKI